MTTQAPAHAERLDLYCTLHLTDVSVALCAVHATEHMAFVREPNVVRKVMDPHPRNRRLVLPELQQSLDLWGIGEHLLVTAGAALHRRNTGDRTAPRIDMTHLTVEPNLRHMVVVTEVDWLGRQVFADLGRDRRRVLRLGRIRRHRLSSALPSVHGYVRCCGSEAAKGEEDTARG